MSQSTAGKEPSLGGDLRLLQQALSRQPALTSRHRDVLTGGAAYPQAQQGLWASSAHATLHTGLSHRAHVPKCRPGCRAELCDPNAQYI